MTKPKYNVIKCMHEAQGAWIINMESTYIYGWNEWSHKNPLPIEKTFPSILSLDSMLRLSTNFIKVTFMIEIGIGKSNLNAENSSKQFNFLGITSPR